MAGTRYLDSSFRRISLDKALLASALLIGFPAFCQTQVDVLTQHNDLARTGTNLQETVLTPAKINAKRFGMIFKRVLDDQVYGQPLIATNVKVGGGTHDLVFLTTVNNSVYAFDANDPSAVHPIWHVNFGTPPNLYSADFGCFDMNGNIGIVGTPVIDAGSGTLYVVALTRAGGGYIERLHALDIATGADQANSPVVIAAPGFDPLMQNQRPGLLLSKGEVYVGYASHCDKEPYHGFLLAYDAKTLQQEAVLNTSPTGTGDSIWQSGQAPAADAAGNIYVVTGNGTWDGNANFSESFLKLGPDLKLLDWFTPSNHEQLDKDDNDLNSSGATLIPGTNLVIGGGKQGVLYTLDVTHFGHLGDQNALQHFQATGSHLHSIVYWQSARNGRLLYIWGQRDKARVYQGHEVNVSNHQLGSGPLASILWKETPLMARPEMNEGHPGAMLSLSANGGKDGILWAAIHASGDSWHESRPGILHAYEADDIDRELWNSLEEPTRDDCGNYAKMAPPTIANGKVYLASFGTQNAGSGQFCVYGLLPAGPPPGAPTGLKATAVQGRISLTWTPVAAAATYSVGVSAHQSGPFVTIASGLTSPTFTSPAADEPTMSFVVMAANSNGQSRASSIVSVSIVKPGAKARAMH
jgi:hypothetical protein